MNEKRTKIADGADQAAETITVKTGRLVVPMQITAVATSMIVMAILSLLLYYIRNIVIIFALAFLAAYVIGPAVRFFERRGMNKVLIVTVFYVLFVAIVIVSVLLLLPLLWDELNELWVSIQNTISATRKLGKL